METHRIETRISLCPRRKKEARIETLTHWLNRVAMAAPEMPRSSPKMKMGSRKILSTPPIPSPITERLALPCQRSRLFSVKARHITGAPHRI